MAAEADPSNYRHPSADDPHWERCFDPSRGERLLRRDAAARPAELIGADGARLRLSHDEAGNLRELSAGTFGLAFAGQTRKWTFAVTDPVGRTEVRLDRGGRRRRLTRGVDALTLELDENERTRRVDLPGSDQALVYDWDEDGCCVRRTTLIPARDRDSAHV